jgi:signal peptidase I
MRFSEILLMATAFTGAIWVFDSIFLRASRMKSILSKGAYRSAVKEPWIVDYARTFFPILLTVFVLRSFLVEPFRIPSGSMHPTLWEGDFIVVNKFDYGIRLPITGKTVIPLGLPKRGDVIVFKHLKEGESIDMIKRVIGLPGDEISYKNKMIYINGAPVKQEFLGEKIEPTLQGKGILVRELKELLEGMQHNIYVHPTTLGMSYNYPFNEVTVPEGSYFVLGDNRDNSQDSRIWGFVKNEDIQGRAFGIWMSWDALQNRIRWSRLFTKIP